MLDAIEPLFAGLGERPSRILAVSHHGELRRRRYTAKALVGVASLADVGSVMVMNGEKQPTLEVALELRSGAGPASSERDRFPRPVSVRAAFRLASPDPVLGFLSRATAHYDVAHGAGVRLPDLRHAAAEIELIGNSALPSAVRTRTDFDAMHTTEAHQKLRRLYPVTIIGPEIWSKLPPLPRLDPAPTVTALGNCTMLTVWPTPCDPRDRAFLRGTVALRAWLWPHTIQNPIDHVDEDPYEYGQP